MKKLTETLIKQRVRSCVTDIKKITQINLTGRELEDVSLLRKMTNVEILSLSFNKITNLADFQYCENLKELYLRRNNISDLNQIQYLKNLPKLEMLMLSENPISGEPLYRQTIIKNIPNLQTLDGFPITPEEKKASAKVGKEIHWTPPPSLQKIKLPDKEEKMTEEKKPTVEPVEEVCEQVPTKESKNAIFQNLSKNNVNIHGTTSSLYALGTGKSSRHLPGNESKKCLSKLKEPKMASCKFCNHQPIDTQVTANMDAKTIRAMPKNANILSATIALIKELDYSGLQVINAEIHSRLNSFEVEFLYNIKSQ